MVLIERELLTQFAQLQYELLMAFAELFPSASRDLMLAVPKQGKLFARGEAWFFQKHGRGIRFRHPESGVVIDSHRFYEGVQNPIDAWRVLQFAESLGLSALTEQAVEDSLASSANSGTLLKTDHPQVYQLA